jgi:hypothetical protein
LFERQKAIGGWCWFSILVCHNQTVACHRPTVVSPEPFEPNDSRITLTTRGKPKLSA